MAKNSSVAYKSQRLNDLVLPDRNTRPARGSRHRIHRPSAHKAKWGCKLFQ